jgi:hypothetical protein
VLQAREILGDVARIIPPEGGYFSLGNPSDIKEAILNIITRHPMSEEALLDALENATPGEAQKALAMLERSGQAKVVVRYGVRFWSAASTRHPAVSLEKRTRSNGKPAGTNSN